MSKIKVFGLGGLNETGKSMYVVDVDGNIFVFDAGLKYSTETMLGVDYILPDYTYIKENKENIKGILQISYTICLIYLYMLLNLQ